MANNVQGKIVSIFVEAGKQRFKISLGERQPQVTASEFWASRVDDPDGIPASPNYDTLFALALWCVTNGVRISVETTADLNQANVPMTSISIAV